jgi:hypothetical protein
MKYDFLIKEKCKNSSEEQNENINKKDNNSFIGSTMLSTYEDFNIFLKKPQDKIIEIRETNEDDICENKESMNDKKNKESMNDKKNKESMNDKKNKESMNDNKNKENTNYTLFESEKKTVENIVKYSSSFINLLLNFIYILKNAFMYLISKKKLNTDTIKDKEIINRFNKHNKKKDKHYKHNEGNDDKHIKKNDNKYIKKMNSYLLELD